VSHDRQWLREQRYGRQFGGLSAILESAGLLIISTPDEYPRISSSTLEQMRRLTPEENQIQSSRASGIVYCCWVQDPGPISIDQMNGIVVRDAQGQGECMNTRRVWV
ncbi:MAG: hypothetical protein LQ341_003079, partial [Variospora aurantia]